MLSKPYGKTLAIFIPLVHYYGLINKQHSGVKSLHEQVLDLLPDCAELVEEVDPLDPLTSLESRRSTHDLSVERVMVGSITTQAFC